MAIGCFHIFVFYFLWLLGEVTLKARSLVREVVLLKPLRRDSPGLSFPKGLAICEDSCDLGAPRDFRSGNMGAFSVRSGTVVNMGG